MSHAIYAPNPTPAPTPAATHRASRASSAHTEDTAPAIEQRDTQPEKKTNSSSADLSFMAALLSSIVNNNQNFSASSAVPSDSDVDGSGEPAVKFGGTFNMDPSMLVLPEGIDAGTLAALLEKSNGEFSAELLAALTPGLTAPGLTTPPIAEAILPEGKSTMPTPAPDTRLIASGLTPADMQKLMDHLKSLAASMTQNQQPVQVPPPVMTVALVPEKAELTPAQIPFVAPVYAAKPEKPAATAPAVPVAPGTIDPADVIAGIHPNDMGEGEFDPVEFRLALKPSRYNNASIYQNPAPAAVTPANAAPVSVNANEVIKGVMKNAGEQAPDVVMSSAVNGESGMAGAMLVSDLDCVLGATSLVPTPAMSTGMTNPVLQNVSAVQTHPATQAVAAIIANKAQQTSGSSGAQTLAIQLDPPELGRLQLKMKYERGEPLKVHVVLEKADTMAMFQRDAHALENALNQAGVKTDSSSLSFSMAQDQNAFQQAMNDQGGENRQGGASGGQAASAPEAEPIETRMPVFTDPKTGLTHYNILA